MLKKLFRLDAMLAAVMLLALSSEAAASSWMRSQGEWLSSTHLQMSSANQYFDQNSDRQPIGCTSNDLYLDQVLEYGQSYYRTLFGKFSVGQKGCGADSSFETGDLELGIRGRIDLFRNGRSWEAALLVPTSSGSISPDRLGVGRLGVKLGAHGRFKVAGDELAPQYLTTGAEMRVFASDAFHRLKIYADYQRLFWDHEVEFGLDGDFAFPRGSADYFENSGRAYGNYDKVNATVSYKRKVGEWSLSFKYYNTLWGRNTDAGNSIGVSVSRTWME